MNLNDLVEKEEQVIDGKTVDVETGEIIEDDDTVLDFRKAAL